MSGKFQSLSPSDQSVVWNGLAATDQQVREAIDRSAAVGPSWGETSLEQRLALVRRYGQLLSDRRTEIAALITREIGKLPWDAAAEVHAAIAKIELSIQAMQQRRGTQVFSADPLERVVRFHPLGVTLVLGPFNFPLHLPGGQIIPALLAGNTVVFKPSQQATAVAQWMMATWQETGLPADVLQMIPGGVDTATQAIDHPATNAVFLTGSRAAGHAIHRQLAGRPGVLLALELGGNNPIVIDRVDAAKAASIVSFSAFVSAGQRCTCARRAIFVESNLRSKQIETLLDHTRQLRVALPGSDAAADVGPLISPNAADQIEQTYRSLLELGCQPLVPMQRDQACRSLVSPAIVDASSLNQSQQTQLGEMEWFGPLLVIQRADSIPQATKLAAETPYGLAAALLGGTSEQFEYFVRHVRAGVVNWNRPTTGAAGLLPFGGLGDSGNHRPAGFYAIDFCNDPVASLQADGLPSEDPWQKARG